MAHVPRPHPSVLALLLCVVAGPVLAGSSDRADDTRRLLTLLGGVATEYREAFDDTGRPTRPIEIEEARLLLAEARDLNARLGVVDAARLAAVDADLASHSAPVDVFGERVTAIATAISERTGIRDEPLPPEPPSVARGQAVFSENCAGCHGAHGNGGGDEAKRLGLKPASFIDLEFMRGETPRDFFNVITLGRRRAG